MPNQNILGRQTKNIMVFFELANLQTGNQETIARPRFEVGQ